MMAVAVVSGVMGVVSMFITVLPLLSQRPLVEQLILSLFPLPARTGLVLVPRFSSGFCPRRRGLLGIAGPHRELGPQVAQLQVHRRRHHRGPPLLAGGVVALHALGELGDAAGDVLVPVG